MALEDEPRSGRRWLRPDFLGWFEERQRTGKGWDEEEVAPGGFARDGADADAPPAPAPEGLIQRWTRKAIQGPLYDLIVPHTSDDEELDRREDTPTPTPAPEEDDPRPGGDVEDDPRGPFPPKNRFLQNEPISGAPRSGDPFPPENSFLQNEPISGAPRSGDPPTRGTQPDKIRLAAHIGPINRSGPFGPPGTGTAAERQAAKILEDLERLNLWPRAFMSLVPLLLREAFEQDKNRQRDAEQIPVPGEPPPPRVPVPPIVAEPKQSDEPPYYGPRTREEAEVWDSVGWLIFGQAGSGGRPGGPQTRKDKNLAIRACLDAAKERGPEVAKALKHVAGGFQNGDTEKREWLPERWLRRYGAEPGRDGLRGGSWVDFALRVALSRAPLEFFLDFETWTVGVRGLPVAHERRRTERIGVNDRAGIVDGFAKRRPGETDDQYAERIKRECGPAIDAGMALAERIEARLKVEPESNGQKIVEEEVQRFKERIKKEKESPPKSR